MTLQPLLASALNVPVSAGVVDDVALIASMLARRGPWVAFCPSDTCPDNNRVLPDGSVRLFDFEGAGWRHAALEAAYCRAPFCTCWCMARMPEGMTERMEAAFLSALAPTDQAGFVDVVTPAAVHYTIVQFHWFRRFVLADRPVPPRAPSTGRQIVYARLLSVAEQRERLPALAQVAEGWPPPLAGDGPPRPVCRCTQRSADPAEEVRGARLVLGARSWLERIVPHPRPRSSSGQRDWQVDAHRGQPYLGASSLSPPTRR